jgi:hypothetical protein
VPGQLSIKDLFTDWTADILILAWSGNFYLLHPIQKDSGNQIHSHSRFVKVPVTGRKLMESKDVQSLKYEKSEF